MCPFHLWECYLVSEKQGLIDKFSSWVIGSFIDMMDNEKEAWTPGATHRGTLSFRD